MDIDVRARLTNFASLTPADSETEFIKLDIAAVADQDYERIQKLNKANCHDYRQSASKVVSTIVRLDGAWSDQDAAEPAFKHNKVVTQGRPRMYYFMVLDCDRELSKVFKTGRSPQIQTEVHMTTGSE